MNRIMMMVVAALWGATAGAGALPYPLGLTAGDLGLAPTSCAIEGQNLICRPPGERVTQGGQKFIRVKTAFGFLPCRADMETYFAFGPKTDLMDEFVCHMSTRHFVPFAQMMARQYGYPEEHLSNQMSWVARIYQWRINGAYVRISDVITEWDAFGVGYLRITSIPPR